MTKTYAMLIGFGLITLFGAFSFIFPERAGRIDAILTATVALATAYLVNQTFNNGVRGGWGKKQIHDCENSRINNIGG